MTDDYVIIKGATGQSERAYFCKPLKYKVGKQWGISTFLYMPDSPKGLLGRDLLEQLETKITFKNGDIILEVKDQRYVEMLGLMLAISETKTEDGEKINKKIIDQVFPGHGLLIYQGEKRMCLWCKSNLQKESNQTELKSIP